MQSCLIPIENQFVGVKARKLAAETEERNARKEVARSKKVLSTATGFVMHSCSMCRAQMNDDIDGDITMALFSQAEDLAAAAAKKVPIPWSMLAKGACFYRISMESPSQAEWDAEQKQRAQYVHDHRL